MEKKKVEAATLQKKKTTISKAKVKKTIKNTLCRPDPIFWPILSEEQVKILEVTLSTYKIEIPEFKKPHWKELKAIPKDQRPKQPKLKKVEGLIFGLSECNDTIKSKECSALIIESTVNPRMLVQPLIEACISNNVPVFCMTGLRKTTLLNFGIPTTCLAVKSGYLQELRSKIEDIAKFHQPPEAINENDSEQAQKIENAQEKMEVDENKKLEISSKPISFTYLYRTCKKTRVFNPSSEESKAKKTFEGQDFIEFSDKPEEKKTNNKTFMKMIVKRVTNNQNRTKRK